MLGQLNTNKSAGPDMFLNEFFSLCYFPKAWSEGFVVPLHQNGSLNNETNYRGITLLSPIGTLFSRVLNNRLNSWADKYSVYIEAEADFRSNMGTVDNIFVLHGIISHMLNEGKRLYCAFIDFTKVLIM